MRVIRNGDTMWPTVSTHEIRPANTSDAMLMAMARRDASARALMVTALETGEGVGFRVEFVPRPCCRYQGSHLDSVERTIHVLTQERTPSGSWQARPDVAIAISLAHEVGHALDPPTVADQSLTDRDAIRVRRMERETTAWSYVEATVARLDLPKTVSAELDAQRILAQLAYERADPSL